MKILFLTILVVLTPCIYSDAGIQAKDIPPKVIIIDNSYGKNKLIGLIWHKNMDSADAIHALGPITEYSHIKVFLVRNGVAKEIDFPWVGKGLELHPWDIILLASPINDMQ